MRVGVVGHVEWIEFIRVPHLPEPGEIVHGTDCWEVPAGGGAVAAVQLAKLAGTSTFLTALGDDDLARRAHRELRDLGVRVEAVVRPQAQRRGVTHVDDAGERTITVLGERVAPWASDPLPWDEIGGMDGVYVTAADAAGIRRARGAGVLVATARILPVLAEAGVELDALVGSSRDEAERYEPGNLAPPPRLVVCTDGERGGFFRVQGSEPRRYEAAPLPGPLVDTYGCGDSFAAALTYALANGDATEVAIRFAAVHGAAAATGRGPYEGQLGSRGGGAREAPSSGRAAAGQPRGGVGSEP